MIKVIDSIPGSGKTQYVIKMMNEASEDQKFIYLTPFLTEVDRIKNSVTSRVFYRPGEQDGIDDEEKFIDKKYDHLKELVQDGKNIVCTHSLFSMADEELYKSLKYENYILIIDEVFETVKQIKSNRDDVKFLLNHNCIKIHENKRVEWLEDPMLSIQYNRIKRFALANNLYCIRDVAFVWNFPIKIFDCFNETYILTYIFESSLQKAYYV